MASLAHKILIYAAADGVVVQPLAAKGQRPPAPAKVRYRDGAVVPASWDAAPGPPFFEAFGIVGLFTVSRISFLVSITRRRQVASISGSPVYVVTDVAVTPCSSQSEANDAIAKSAENQNAALSGAVAAENGVALSDSDDEGLQVPTPEDFDEVEDAAPPVRGEREAERFHDAAGGGTTIAQDVISRGGAYGTFARRWFSRGRGLVDQRTPPPPTRAEIANNAPSVAGAVANGLGGTGEAAEGPTASALLPKLLRTTQVLFGSSQSFFFSYDYDLTRSVANQNQQSPSLPVPDRPLCHRVDEIYFWNKHLLMPFLLAGQTTLALPLVQGFVGQRSFTADSSPPQKDTVRTKTAAGESVELSTLGVSPSLPQRRPTPDLRPSERRFLMALISRRSTQRAGLRYLRRGINEQGHVANTVETEQILSPEDWGPVSRVHSFVQVRGSIPLFFTQTPYAFKPAPVLQHSPDANLAACRRHFDALGQRYGGVQVVNLVEKRGNESIVGDAYRQLVARINEGPNDAQQQQLISWEWFDFHFVCRGMKFERVGLLLDTLRPALDRFGSTVVTAGVAEQTQTGVLRTNCMDCLDRTNVCQSSFARYMLGSQLRAEGIDEDAQVDQQTLWFNELWADNGDAVSKQYASTAAMKGDYTRTRKRDYRGTLNDLGLSVSRFYSGMVNDYFSQAAIDFLLGNVSSLVFEEFEANMMTKDPAVSVTRMRELAIEQCRRRVVADEAEEFAGGWVLLAPRDVHLVWSTPLVEVVLLLTDAALYVCQFDWDTDKVSSFERIALGNVTRITHGTYVTSTLSRTQADEARNVGILIEYALGENVMRRRNTRTLDTLEPQSRSSGKESRRPRLQHVALKAPYTTSSMPLEAGAARQTEAQLVASICGEIGWLVRKDHGGSVLQQGVIISAEEARRSTGLLEQLGHSIKKMVWA